MTKEHKEMLNKWAKIHGTSVIMEHLNTEIKIYRDQICDAGRCSMGDASEYYRMMMKYYMEIKADYEDLLERKADEEQIKTYFNELENDEITEILNEYGLD